MGGRGATSGISGGGKNDGIAEAYSPYEHGQITRREAGLIYKAVKNGNIVVKPETTKELYKATENHIRYARERYTRDYLYYDRIYGATKAILNNDFKEAQREITDWEEDNIKWATKKSKWYKYQKEYEEE